MVLKPFIKPFEAPQRSVKIKNQIFILMQLTTMNGAGRVNTTHDIFWLRVNLINHRAGNTRVVVDVSSNLLFAC